MMSIEKIESFLEDLNNTQLIELWNQYCENISDFENSIMSNDEDFFQTYFSDDIMECVRAVCYGEYNYTDDYVRINAYGNLISYTDRNIRSLIVLSELAENIIDDEPSYSYYEYLSDIFENDDEDDDENNK